MWPSLPPLMIMSFNRLQLSWLLRLATFYLLVCRRGSHELILPLAAWCNNPEPLRYQFFIRDSASDAIISGFLNGYVTRTLYYESFVISSASGLPLVCLLCFLDLATILLIVFRWITIENGTF
jgi:hypothetical protein